MKNGDWIPPVCMSLGLILMALVLLNPMGW